MSQLKILLVQHRRPQRMAESGLEEAIRSELAADVHYVENGWTLPALADYDVVIVFVRFAELAAGQRVEWGDFQGLRVLMDHDSFQDYGGWPGSPYEGRWTEILHRDAFDLIVVSGMKSRQHFESRGFRAEVVYKGYSPVDFHDLRLHRSGLGHFGSLYPARQKMLRTLKRHGHHVVQVAAPYSALNWELNQLTAVLVCNLGSRPSHARLTRLVGRYMPGSLITTVDAPEPMLKNFEAAAAGCAVFMDYTPDLEVLGFVDSVNAIIYHDLDELVSRLDGSRDEPLPYALIGERAAQLCRERHTWEKRARALYEHLLERLSSA